MNRRPGHPLPSDFEAQRINGRWYSVNTHTGHKRCHGASELKAREHVRRLQRTAEDPMWAWTA